MIWADRVGVVLYGVVFLGFLWVDEGTFRPVIFLGAAAVAAPIWLFMRALDWVFTGRLRGKNRTQVG